MKPEPTNKDHITRQIEKLNHHLEALRIADYLELLEKPRKLIITNFIAGIARGLGFAIGTTVVFAIVIEILRRIILINVPIISSYLTEILKIIDLKK